MSLLHALIERPELGYVLVAELLPRIASENQYVTSELRDRLRAWTALMARCPRMPPCMGALLVFWLAKTHSGVQHLFELEEPDPAVRAQIPALFEATSAFIDRLCKRNITPGAAPRRAAQFYVLLLLVTHPQFGAHYLERTMDAPPDKVAFEKKEALAKARLAHKGAIDRSGGVVAAANNNSAIKSPP